MKLILVESQKLHWIFFWRFSDKVDGFRKFTILRPNFGNNLFLKLKFFDKSCCPRFESQNFAILWVYLLCPKKSKKNSMQFLWFRQYQLHCDKFSSNSIDLMKCLLSDLNRTRLTSSTWPPGKTMVLPWFCKIEYGSSGSRIMVVLTCPCSI